MASPRNKRFAEAASSPDFVIRPNDQDTMSALAKLTKDIDSLDDKCAWIEKNVRGKSASHIKRATEQTPEPKKSLTRTVEEAPTPSESNFIELREQTQVKTKMGKVVKAIIKANGSVVPARGECAVKRGRQALAHRKAITVGRGKVVNIYLEGEFEAAADTIASKKNINKTEWFKNVINNAGEMNPTAALRLDIVKNLTELVQP